MKRTTNILDYAGILAVFLVIAIFTRDAISFIIILSAIVFIHEFGHYFVAKLCGVRITTFSIGFGKELFGLNDRSGTRWKFSLLPLGGYVKMFGDSSEASTPDADAIEEMCDEDKAVSFHHKPLWKKAAVVAAGPIANFILSIVILTYFVYNVGISSTEPVVGEVIPDTPAMEAGLQLGDRVLEVDGKKVYTFNDIPNRIMTNLGTPVTLTLERDGKIQDVIITPIQKTDTDALGNEVKRPLIGFRSQAMAYEDVSLPYAVVEATKRTYHFCAITIDALGQMITGKRSPEELKGPIGIAKLSGQVTQSGDTLGQTTRMILWFIALLSANLGLVNLLPIPLLDGGHLLFYALESIRGRPIAEKFQEYSYRIGFVLLAMVMAFTIFNDIRQI